MANELTERQEAILGLIVREYISNAKPVASTSLVEDYPLGVSSATVRNDMARLEELGYLAQPHTSAGRVPTEQGYRYFVERLMEKSELPEVEQRLIRHQFHQARMDLEQWMRLAAAVLAHTSHTASLVTSPKAPAARLKRLELITISESLILAVAVTAEGLVRQQMIGQPQPPLTQESLNAVNNKLNALLAGYNRTQIQQRPFDLTTFEAQVRDVVVELLERVDTRDASRIYRDGLLHILRHPDLAETDAVRQVVEIMEERPLLQSIVQEVMESSTGSGVQVIIGGEGQWDELSEVSLVVAPYGVEGYAAGMMGVVGPRRMPYGRAVSTVRFVSDVVSHLLATVYGTDSNMFTTSGDPKAGVDE